MESNVRVIAATNKDLRTLIQKGLFRQDLFHRLKMVELKSSSLWERSEDIPLDIVQSRKKDFVQKVKKILENVRNLPDNY